MGYGTERGGPETDRGIRLSTELFARLELAVYIALGILLSMTALLALASAMMLLWEGVRDWGATNSIFLIIDRLLFIFMLIEILHTVRVSIRSRVLECEPFLIVGLIASIRRVLVITLKSSEVTQETHWSTQSESLFRSSMIELAVLGALILIIVVSIYLLRRGNARSAMEAIDTH
jgi:uncharacterized membrane protein (DUF373 family)